MVIFNFKKPQTKTYGRLDSQYIKMSYQKQIVLGLQNFVYPPKLIGIEAKLYFLLSNVEDNEPIVNNFNIKNHLFLPLLFTILLFS